MKGDESNLYLKAVPYQPVINKTITIYMVLRRVIVRTLHTLKPRTPCPYSLLTYDAHLLVLDLKLVAIRTVVRRSSYM